MSRFMRIALIIVLLVSLLPATPVAADKALPPGDALPPGELLPPFTYCQEIWPSANEAYLVCVPPDWTGPFDVVVFAHGYVAPHAPPTQYYDQLWLPGDVFLPYLVNSQGYAFISTSYTKNGLAVKEGLADTRRLIEWFKTTSPWAGLPQSVYLIGASEGGLITTLAAEKGAPIVGGLALCGPIGNFRSQINYWGDFRVLFDYFFPAIQIPNSPINIDESIWPNWDAISRGIGLAVMTDTPATQQLLATSRAPIDPADPMSVVSTTVGILSYNVFATNEAKVELNGQPFDNKYKWYFGSANDRLLNAPGGVQRFKALLPPASLLDISRNYQTTGKLKVPLVTMHTTGDPIVPYWHETMYNVKALFGGSAFKHLNIPIDRYGHCVFTAEESLAAFAVLHYMVTGTLSDKMPADLAPAAQENYHALIEKFRSQLTNQ
jgi:pimeloyl-ACP methyl ester carboxylesterase